MWDRLFPRIPRPSPGVGHRCLGRSSRAGLRGLHWKALKPEAPKLEALKPGGAPHAGTPHPPGPLMADQIGADRIDLSQTRHRPRRGNGPGGGRLPHSHQTAHHLPALGHSRGRDVSGRPRSSPHYHPAAGLRRRGSGGRRGQRHQSLPGPRHRRPDEPHRAAAGARQPDSAGTGAGLWHRAECGGFPGVGQRGQHAGRRSSPWEPPCSTCWSIPCG